MIGGVCLIAAELDKDGRIVQLTDVHRLVYGERTGGNSARMNALNQVMQGPAFKAGTSDNILQEMWEKWVMLASLGAATCLMRANIGEIEAVPGGAELARAILDECSAISTACGYAPGVAFLARTQKLLTAHGSTLTSSMYRDLSKTPPWRWIRSSADLLQRGRKLGLATPLLESACMNLRIYEARHSQPAQIESGGQG